MDNYQCNAVHMQRCSRLHLWIWTSNKNPNLTISFDQPLPSPKTHYKNITFQLNWEFPRAVLYAFVFNHKSSELSSWLPCGMGYFFSFPHLLLSTDRFPRLHCLLAGARVSSGHLPDVSVSSRNYLLPEPTVGIQEMKSHMFPVSKGTF